MLERLLPSPQRHERRLRRCYAIRQAKHCKTFHFHSLYRDLKVPTLTYLADIPRMAGSLGQYSSQLARSATKIA